MSWIPFLMLLTLSLRSLTWLGKIFIIALHTRCNVGNLLTTASARVPAAPVRVTPPADWRPAPTPAATPSRSVSSRASTVDYSEDAFGEDEASGGEDDAGDDLQGEGGGEAAAKQARSGPRGSDQEGQQQQERETQHAEALELARSSQLQLAALQAENAALKLAATKEAETAFSVAAAAGSGEDPSGRRAGAGPAADAAAGDVPRDGAAHNTAPPLAWRPSPQPSAYARSPAGTTPDAEEAPSVGQLAALAARVVALQGHTASRRDFCAVLQVLQSLLRQLCGEALPRAGEAQHPGGAASHAVALQQLQHELRAALRDTLIRWPDDPRTLQGGLPFLGGPLHALTATALTVLQHCGVSR